MSTFEASTTSMSDRSREPWRSKEMQSLFAAIRDLDTTAEAQAFLRDLCTVSELEAMAHRWQVAGLVDAGLPYLEVAARSGASTTTVTRVANSLRYGQDGYRRALDRQASATSKEQRSPTISPPASPRGKKATTPNDPTAGKGSTGKGSPGAAGRRRKTGQPVSSARRGVRAAPASG